MSTPEDRPSGGLASDIIGVAALTVLAAGTRFRWLAGHAEATGTDGYYYVVQVTDAVASGSLHVPDGSWVLWALAAVHLVIPDPVLAVKLGASLLAAACVPAAWWAGRALGGPAASWLCAGWVVASPTLTHLAADFPKNLGALAPFLVLVAAGARGGRAWPVAVVAGLACATAHRTGAALVLVGAAGVVLARVAGAVDTPVPGRRALAVVAGVVLFAGASLTQPNLLHPSDLERLVGQLRGSPWPPLPIAYATLRPTSPLEIAEWFLPWFGLAAAAFSAAGASARRRVLLPLVLVASVLVFPLWADGELDLGYRLMLLGPLVGVLLIAACLPPDAQLPRQTGARVLFVAMLAAPYASWEGWSPSIDPPYARWRQLIDRTPRPLPALTIAHAGLSFLVDHQTGAEALPWAPEAELDRASIGRIAWGIRDSEWVAFGARDVVRLDPDYSYLPEAEWEAFVTRARSSDEPDLLRRLDDPRNPARVRPSSLLRNR
ncbi:MAG: hypothetical protein ACI8PZ_003869 [Myxococcota bacterium]|jgi:hypothetical protein